MKLRFNDPARDSIIPLFAAVLVYAGAVSLPAQDWQTNGLVAHYPLNGKADDVSGNGRHGTVWGVVATTNRFGGQNEACDFNGNNAFIQCPADAYFGSNFTISAWVNVRSLRWWARVLDFGNGQDADNVFWSVSKELSGISTLRVYDGANLMLSCYAPSALPLNVWTHMAVARVGDIATFYLNGTQVAVASGLWSANDGVTVSNYIGRSNYRDDSLFDGQLDDIRMWRRALSSEEVGEVFAQDPSCVPRGATATAQIVNGFVVGATVTDSGCGYTNTPQVLIKDGGGTGAIAIATVSDGRVVAVNIMNVGHSYTNTPRVVIESPPFMPTLSIAVSRVRVTQHVILGKTYVLEASTDLINWTATGPEFIADDETIVTEFDVDVTGRYFRIRQLP